MPRPKIAFLPFIYLLVFGVISVFGQAVKPTLADLRYSDEYERSVLDLWLADSNKPTPLVIYFHGGGFKTGDKKFLQRSPMLRKYFRQGVSFASVNYPFLKQVGGKHLKILDHCPVAIRFLKQNSQKHNLDTEKISVMGNSAGALITCHVGHAFDLGVQSIFPIQQPMGTPLVTIPRLRKGGPPIFVYNRSGPKDRVHHPDNAIFVKRKCDSLGVECIAYGVKGSGLPVLPEGNDVNDLAMKFFQKSWGEIKEK